MQAKELIEGAKYILKQVGDPVAVYEGKHDGVLTLADGATFYGGTGTLRFRYTDAGGVERVALLQSGADIREPVATREERELREAARAARLDAAKREATELLVSLGFEVFTQYGSARGNPVGLTLRFQSEDANLLEIDEMTIGKLKAALKTYAQSVLYLIDHGVAEADAVSGRALTIRPVETA